MLSFIGMGFFMTGIDSPVSIASFMMQEPGF